MWPAGCAGLVRRRPAVRSGPRVLGANIGGGSGVTGVTSTGYGVFGFSSTGNAVFGLSDSGGILPQRHPDPGGRSLVGEEHRDRADADEPGPGHHPGQCGRSLRAGSDPGHRIARVVYHSPEQDRLKERQGCLVRRQLRRPPRGNARSPSLGVMFLDRRAPRSVCLDCFGRPIRCQIPSSAVYACPETYRLRRRSSASLYMGPRGTDTEG